MKTRIMWFLAILISVIVLDQWLKIQVLEGFRWESRVVSIVLVYNDGVAFSMFAFLQGWLKWIQIALLAGLGLYLTLANGAFRQYWLGFGFILGGGIGNVIDRFVYGKVVDYVYWHYWFEFAIFNFADVCIDIGVGILIISWLWHERNTHRAKHKGAQNRF